MDLNKYFLDANIFIRYILKDNEKLSPKAKLIIDEIADLKAKGYLSTLTLHEIIYVLEKYYLLTREKICSEILTILKITALEILDMDKLSFKQVLKDYKKTKVDFPDCVYKQIVLQNNLKLLSFDGDFKKIKLARYDAI